MEVLRLSRFASILMFSTWIAGVTYLVLLFCFFKFGADFSVHSSINQLRIFRLFGTGQLSTQVMAS